MHIWYQSKYQVQHNHLMEMSCINWNPHKVQRKRKPHWAGFHCSKSWLNKMSNSLMIGGQDSGLVAQGSKLAIPKFCILILTEISLVCRDEEEVLLHLPSAESPFALMFLQRWARLPAICRLVRFEQRFAFFWRTHTLWASSSRCSKRWYLLIDLQLHELQ